MWEVVSFVLLAIIGLVAVGISSIIFLVGLYVRRAMIVLNVLEEKPLQWFNWSDLLQRTKLKPKALRSALRPLVKSGKYIEARESPEMVMKLQALVEDVSEAVLLVKKANNQEETETAEIDIDAMRARLEEFTVTPLTVCEFRTRYIKRRRRRKEWKEMVPEFFDGIPRPA